MADKVEKPKKSKPKPRRDEKGVLAALPSTRPERIGTRRVSAPQTSEQPEAAQAAAPTGQAKPAAKKPAAKRARAKPSAAKASAAKRSSATAGAAKTTAAKSSSATAGTAKPAAAKQPAAARAIGAVPRAAAPEPRPRAVREGAPGMGTSGKRDQRAPAPARRGDERGEATSGDERSEAGSPEHGRPSGVELVTTAVQAAGELTKVGLTIGGQIIKRAVDRLPKP